MADVVFDLDVDIDGLEKGLKKAGKILSGFSKRSTRKKEEEQKKEVEGEKKVTKATIAEQNKRDRNDKRLSRKRARNRLKQIKARIKAEKAADREIEKNRKATEKRRGRVARGIGRGIGRGVGGIGGGLIKGAALQFDLVGAGLQIANFEKRVVQFAETANVALPEEIKLTNALNNTALATGKSRDELLDFVKSVFDTGGGVKLATQNLNDMAEAMVAFNSDAVKTGALLSSISDFGIKGKAAGGIIDVISAQAFLGKISAQQFGEIGPELFGAGASRGFKGREGIAQLGALAQFAARQSAGPEASKTAVVALLSGLLEKSGKIEKEFGIKTTKGGSVVDPFEKIKSIIESPKATNKLLLSIFGKEAARVVSPLRLSFQRNKGFSELSQFVQTGVGAKGGANRIFKRVSETSGGKLDKLTSLITVLTDKALLGGFTRLVESLTEFSKDESKINQLISDFESIGEAVVTLADVVNSVTPSFKVIKNIFTNPLPFSQSEEQTARVRAKDAAISAFLNKPGTFPPPQSGGGLLAGVNVTNNIKVDPIRKTVKGKTIVSQSNPATGKTTRTHVPIKQGAQ